MTTKLSYTIDHVQMLQEELKSAQLHIKELREFVDATKVWFSTETMIGKGLRDKAEKLLSKQPDTRALDKALLEAEIKVLIRAASICEPYGEEFQWTISVRQAKLAELNKE